MWQPWACTSQTSLYTEHNWQGPRHLSSGLHSTHALLPAMTRCSRAAKADPLPRAIGLFWRLALAWGLSMAFLNIPWTHGSLRNFPQLFLPFSLTWGQTCILIWQTSYTFWLLSRFSSRAFPPIKFWHISSRLVTCFLEMPRLTQVSGGSPLDKLGQHQPTINPTNTAP